MLAQVEGGLAHHEALADGHVRSVKAVDIVTALGGGAGGLVGAGGHRGVGDVEDLGLGALLVDAVEDALEVDGHAAARARKDAQLAALLEHLGGVKGAVVDGGIANGDVHGNEFDAQLGRLGSGNVGAALCNDDDVAHCMTSSFDVRSVLLTVVQI